MTRLSPSTVRAGTGLMILLAAVGSLLTFPTALPAQNDDPDQPVVRKQPEDAGSAKTEKKAVVPNPFPKRIPAPELDGGIEWLNTSGELSLKDLRGKVVVLDFWTYCCINCMHVLPDLAYLEKKFDKELVVIGVHSAKFDNEKESGNIRKAILRYEIVHPVINDARMTVWRKFDVRSWPTLALIDPEGFYCGAVSGEGNREVLEQAISRVIAHHKSKGTLDENPVQFALERHKQPDGPLKFPGKVLADPAGNRLFISDSNHNRIIVAGLDGALIDVIGTGQIGWEDGDYNKAQFDHPQGMCLIENVLYVADTENHLLRKVDLDIKRVSTLAGNGKQAAFREPGGKLRQISLNSPWDVYALEGFLYVAMAGPHQIWSHKLESGNIHPYAGSGREDILNGTLKDSALAQPSGIASDGTWLYVVDSEGSSVRKIATKHQPALDDSSLEVDTIAGTFNLPNGQSLFAFGDVDGVGNEARLQHPLGIAYYGGKLIIADSYNHKLKMIDPETRACETWLGTGKPGSALDPVELSEPAGLTVAGETLYVADTNNHRILTVNLKTKQASEFAIAGLTPPIIPDEPAEEAAEAADPTAETQTVKVKAGERFHVEIGFQLPDDYKLNPLVPVKYSLTAEEDQTVVAADQLVKRRKTEVNEGKAVLDVPVTDQSGKTELILSVSYGYCREGNGALCKIATSTWKIAVESAADASSVPLKLTATP